MSIETKRAINEHLREFDYLKKQSASHRQVSHKFTLEIADLEMKRTQLENKYNNEFKTSTELHKSLTSLTEKYREERIKTLREMNEVKKQAARLRGLDSNHLATCRRLENDYTKSKDKLEKFQSSHSNSSSGGSKLSSNKKKDPISKTIIMKGGTLLPSKSKVLNLTCTSLNESVLKPYLNKMSLLNNENHELRTMMNEVKEQFIMLKKEAMRNTAHSFSNINFNTDVVATQSQDNEKVDEESSINNSVLETSSTTNSHEKEEDSEIQTKQLLYQLKNDIQLQIQDLRDIITTKKKEEEEKWEIAKMEKEKKSVEQEEVKSSNNQEETNSTETVEMVDQSSEITSSQVAVCNQCDANSVEMNSMQMLLSKAESRLLEQDILIRECLFTNQHDHKITYLNEINQSLQSSSKSKSLITNHDNIEEEWEEQEEINMSLEDIKRRELILNDKEKENLKLQEKLDFERIEFEENKFGHMFPLKSSTKHNKSISSPSDKSNDDEVFSPIQLNVPPTPNTFQLLKSMGIGIELPPSQLFPED